MVFHPGAHMGTGEEAGIAPHRRGHQPGACADAGVQDADPGRGHCRAGHRAGLAVRAPAGDAGGRGARRSGSAFCLDTCHLFAAGYDLRTAEAYAATLDEFDRLCGIERLKCFHFNDAKKPLGSRVDRHDHIGTGQLGLDAFGFILNDPRLVDVPKILETEKSEDMHEDVENLRVLRGLIR